MSAVTQQVNEKKPKKKTKEKPTPPRVNKQNDAQMTIGDMVGMRGIENVPKKKGPATPGKADDIVDP